MRETSNAVCTPGTSSAPGASLTAAPGTALWAISAISGIVSACRRPDIVFAGRQSLGFQRDDERFGDIVDMHIVIDELRIAGNFRDASGAGVADHRTEMAIGAPIRAVYPGYTQADAFETLFGGEAADQLLAGDLGSAVNGGRPERRVLGDRRRADVATPPEKTKGIRCLIASGGSPVAPLIRKASDWVRNPRV